MMLIAREARVQNAVCHETWTESVVESGLLAVESAGKGR
jgi:hypothetical protein